MSIRIRLQSLVDDGVLDFIAPTVASRGSSRDVFVSQEVQSFLRFEGDIDPAFERAAGRALAKIDSFACGNMVVFGMNPFVKSPASLVSRNKPVENGIVELRVSGYKPDARIFGGFARIDALVLLTWAPKTGLKYAREIARCRAAWNSHFSPLKPLVGASHAEYISANVIAG